MSISSRVYEVASSNGYSRDFIHHSAYIRVMSGFFLHIDFNSLIFFGRNPNEDTYNE